MSPRSCVKTASLFLIITAHSLSSVAIATDVAVCTDAGSMVISIDDEDAPLHAANFLEYVDQGHYSGTVFHRVISGFMVQGGGFDRQFQQKATLGNVENESRNGLSNVRGSIAAARTADPHSATAQFFINLVNNTRLDGNANDWGYTVFGAVVDGMQSVDDIAQLPTRAAGPFPTDVPEPLVGVRSMARLDRTVLESLPEEGRAQAITDQIKSALEAGDMAGVMGWVGHYRASCSVMSPDILIMEATAATALQRMPRAKSALDEYFSIADESHNAYEEATGLYEIAAPGTTPQMARQAGTCVAPQVPDIPDGTRGALEDMLQGQERVQAFMSDSTAYLECLDEIIDDRRSDDEETRDLAISEYNRMVDVTQQLGIEFNQQVKAFRARE